MYACTTCVNGISVRISVYMNDMYMYGCVDGMPIRILPTCIYVYVYMYVFAQIHKHACIRYAQTQIHAGSINWRKWTGENLVILIHNHIRKHTCVYVCLLNTTRTFVFTHINIYMQTYKCLPGFNCRKHLQPSSIIFFNLNFWSVSSWLILLWATTYIYIYVYVCMRVSYVYACACICGCIRNTTQYRDTCYSKALIII